MEMSRRAGMAEVATGVLHNIGNVLNSANLELDTLGTTVRESRQLQLGRLLQLWEAQEDLPTFLGTERGASSMALFSGLVEALADERARMDESIHALRSHLDHVKTVVSRQQDLARATALMQRTTPSALVAEALELVSQSVSDPIVLNRQLDDHRQVELPRSRVLQVLVNLLTNARDAVVGVAGPEIRVSTRVGDDGSIVFRVADNGVGIDPSLEPLLFNHGFTTKPDGHGFGLHDSANAAVAMGGSLRATSDGIGHGACFTLTLPPPAEVP